MFKEQAVKSVILTSVVCFACALLLAAQSSNSEAQNEHAAAASKVQTIRGCLTMTGHTYVLLGGTPLRQYRVTGGNLGALKGKEEHTVEITGPVGHVESGASPNGTYGPGSTTGVGYYTIRAQSVKEVSGNCG
jgi:hypothetical protein